MDILQTIRTVYKDTDEIAGWCDLNTYKGSETNIHLRGMYQTLLKSADEIERFQIALIQQNKYNNDLIYELEQANKKIEELQKTLRKINSTCKVYKIKNAIEIISDLTSSALTEKK